MQVSGFVLAGGRSKRMGREKALLPYRHATLVEHVAGAVRDAAGSVTLVGDPAKLGGLGLPVLPDTIPGCGPASGIATALKATHTDWNLIVACDMPAISSGILGELLRAAETTGANCVAAAAPDGEPEPLCALYHRRCLRVLARAILDKRLKMKELLNEIGVRTVAVPRAALANVNTADEWLQFQGATTTESGVS